MISGEDVWWWRLADRLKTPVATVKQTTTSADFVKWVWWIKQREKDTTRTETYLAEIIALLRHQVTKKATSRTKEIIPFRYGRANKKMTKEEATRIARARLGL